MNGGHEGLFDAEIVVQDFDDGRQTVGRAAGVTHHRHIGAIVLPRVKYRDRYYGQELNYNLSALNNSLSGIITGA